MARRLAEEGCAVLVHGRNPVRAEGVAAELGAAGAVADIVLGDLADDEAAAKVARRAREWGVDVLVNNAGPFVEHGWESAEPSAWLEAMNGNVLSAVRMIRALTPGMRERGWAGSSTWAAARRRLRCRTWSSTRRRRRRWST